jgi:hypothetical protein
MLPHFKAGYFLVKICTNRPNFHLHHSVILSAESKAKNLHECLSILIHAQGLALQIHLTLYRVQQQQ